jgi:uncharacterized protein (TIGR02001 family)
VPAALFPKAPAAVGFLTLTLLGTAAARADVATPVAGLQFGGGLALTSDYIYRGVSDSDGQGAVQGDLHLSSTGGTFLGAWASSRDSNLEPDANSVLELYLGHRFELSTGWSATASARSRYFLGSSSYQPSDDYQEISAALTYLDRWSLSVTSIPNAVRYWFFQRLSRTPAWVADTSAQWALTPQFLLTAGAGYYYSSGTGPGIYRATGYAYGNVGAAYEWHAWRLDVGYFLAQDAARRIFPYPVASEHFAVTLAWHF